MREISYLVICPLTVYVVLTIKICLPGVGRRTVGKIPRLEGLMKRKPALRPTTPSNKILLTLDTKKTTTFFSVLVLFKRQILVLVKVTVSVELI